MRVDIKALSVNQAWQGRRFKTPKYNQYQKDVLTLLRPLEIPDGDLELSLVFGHSNKASDIDNGVKPFVDILQKKYGFNDSRIYRMIIDKVIVPKGKEYIEFSVKSLEIEL